MFDVILADDEIFKHASQAVWDRVVQLPYGVNLHLFEDPADAYAKVVQRRSQVKVVIADFAMPGCDGINLLHSVKSLSPDARRILISNLDTINKDLFLENIDQMYVKEDLEVKQNLHGFLNQINWIIHEQLAYFPDRLDENRSLLSSRNL